jgi:hypothetical protein
MDLNPKDSVRRIPLCIVGGVDGARLGKSFCGDVLPERTHNVDMITDTANFNRAAF